MGLIHELLGADIIYPSTDESRKVKPGRTRRHDVDGVAIRFFTTNGCIVKGQTRLADVLEFADDFGFAAENLKSVVPDAVPAVLSSFSFQRDLHCFQRYRDSDGEEPENAADRRS